MASALIMKPKDPQNLQEEPAAFSWSNDVKYHHNEGGRGRADRRKPVEGKAAAGAPIATVPEEDLSVVVPAKYLSEEYFIVQAQGDSMTGSGIDSGDFCVFQRDAYQDDGAVMYVQLDGATDLPDGAIKRVYRRGKQVELRSTNPAYAPMLYPASDVALNGVFVSVIKPERRAD